MYRVLFKNRFEAGKKLAGKLVQFKEREDVILFAVPKGGVVVAKAISDILKVPFDIVLAKKIGAPFNSEFAIAAVDITGDVVVNQDNAEYLMVSKEYIEHQKIRVLDTLRKQLVKYRGSVDYETLLNRVAIIVDDGIATGATTKACIRFLSKLNPRQIYIATPVIAPSTLKELEKDCDGVFYLISSEPFWAVGQFYVDFSDVSDEEVQKLLN
ncbi:phosphoribosyltransferase family protein [Caldicellulosiruptor morganii]|uniref:Phosphoribosyltransferase family protein n=1 Tax=Caldicellulosiruptor morganii TaxID=1387555 RepID=A0ABY7BN96_9FIRM|nr:phosphoribosyltransferase family protein [Caldicellulosiruptor morganii]